MYNEGAKGVGVSTITVGNKSVILVDCSKKTPERAGEIGDLLEKAKALVASKPEKSVYIITDVTNLKFNNEMSGMFKDYAVANAKYVKASVLVGLSGTQMIVFSAVKALTKREFHLSPTLNDAKQYLASIE
jgi:hypothetical protein